MASYQPDELSDSLERERTDIANLQARVQRLVARRTDAVPEKKKEAEELQRDVETLAETTLADTRRSAEVSTTSPIPRNKNKHLA